MNRLTFAISLFAGLALVRPSFAASSDRDDQWLYRHPNGAPIAVFMDWNYSKVLFRASCAKGILVIRYFGDEAVKLARGDSMSLLLGNHEYKLAVAFGDNVLEGKIALTPAVSAAIASASEIDIDAPTEMGEPWYIGSAPALKRIVKECR